MFERQPTEPLLFILTGLAVWRVTALLAYESGPFRIFDRLRRGMVDVRLGSLVGCFHCLGFWIAGAGVLIVYEVSWWSILLWLAVAGVVSIVERWLGGTMSQGELGDDL